MKKWSISGVTILTPDKKIKNGSIEINRGKITKLSSEELNNSISANIDKGVLVPGLINSHDHLLGTYYPKVGNGPYINYLPWDNDLKSSPIYEERQQVEDRDLYLLGAYRNLLSGVTTVSDHIPHFVAEPYYDILPMKVIKDYALAHSVASFALSWGDGIDIEYQKAVKNKQAFVTHIAEGFDEETINDLNTLDKKGGLGEHSVLVHGISFSESDMKRIKESRASVVWCADSNIFMFDRTINIKMLLDMGINVCIGTDSPMTGGVNLLYEMKFNKDFFKKLYGEKLSDEVILNMVTINSARAFKLQNTGQIKEGNIADIVVFNGKEDPSAGSVVSAELKDILLVVIDGMPVYGNIEFSDLFDSLMVNYQEIVVDGVEKIIIGDLLGLLRRISRAVGFNKEFPFIPVQFESEQAGEK